MLSYDLYKIPPGFQREERSRKLLNGKPIKLDEPGIPYVKMIHMFKKWRKVFPEEYLEDTCPVPSRVNGIEEAPVRILGEEQFNLITNYVSTDVRRVEQVNNNVCTDVRGGEHDNLITNWLSTDVNIVNLCRGVSFIQKTM